MTRWSARISNYSYWRLAFRTFLKNKAVMLLVILIAAIIVMGFVYPMGSDIDPNKSSFTCAARP